MLTVLMATYNGAETLPEVLNAYCKLDSPDGGWKLIIVDNGSTDNTKEIITSFRSRLPLTYIFEPTIGKSVALNTGLLSITGDLLVIADDDALPRPDWLVQMRVASDSQPACSIFGGAVVPHWEIPPDDWILTFCWVLTITDPALEEGAIVPSAVAGFNMAVLSAVAGPNMAVRSEVIKAGYMFDTSLGPVGPRCRGGVRGLGMGEDADFIQRLGKAGFKAWHCKRALVAHMIRKDQMKKEGVLRRAVPMGRTHCRWEYREGLPSRPVLWQGIPRYMIREILVQAVHVARAKLSQNTDTVFKERWRLYYLVGRAIEARILHRRDGL